MDARRLGLDLAERMPGRAPSAIVTVGYCIMGGTGGDACPARYNTDGSLDNSFDGDGRVATATAPGTGGDYMSAVLLQPDRRILSARDCSMGATGVDTCLARYDADGSLDTTFDGDGRATVSIARAADDDVVFTAALQPDGRIVVAGFCEMGAAGYDVCVARLNPDGSPDTTFDGDGRLTTAVAPGTSGSYIAPITFDVVAP